ncbi:hypothetical protein KGQ64_13325 [bacterium]|nr:hypothetical protein [bacterium]
MSPLGLALLAALVAALVASGLRRARTARIRREIRDLPGSAPETALAVDDFGEMDAAIALRACPCGGRPTLAGEGSREVDGRRFRVARLVCPSCEEEQFVFFETTRLFH